MSGPSSSDRQTLRSRLDRRLLLAELFGWTVGIGLLVEYGEEIADCIIKWHWPSIGLIGGLLVTLGVFGEVFFSMLAGRTTDELQERADTDVAQANKMAAESLERAAQADQKAAEAIERAEKERTARTEMLSQLRPRTFTRSQMDEFVAQIEGRVLAIDLFTLAEDPEAAMYGTAVLEALRRANVKVAWHRSERFPHEIIGNTGIELYEYPERVIGDALWEAFFKAGQSLVFIAPKQPLDGVPTPSLFVARQVPAFLEYPEYSVPEGKSLPTPPWDPR